MAAGFDFDFDSIGDDNFDFGGLFADESEEKKKEPKAAPAEEKAEKKAPEAPAEGPSADEKPAIEEVDIDLTPKAQAEEPETKEEPVAEAPKAEEKPAEEPEAEAVKEEKAEESAETAAPEAEAPAKAEAPETETDEEEPVIEVKVEKKPRKVRKTKKTKAKAEEPKAEAEETTPVVAAAQKNEPIDEDIVKNLILVLGPTYEAFKKDVQSRLNEIRVQAGMLPAVVKTMIQKNNELDRKLFMEGEGYIEAYTTLADRDTGLIFCTRAAAESAAKGSASEKKLAGTLAVMNYTDPLTGKKINLLQYANALKQAVSFVNSAKDHVKSTSIALSTMSKVA